jgi:hypothetical protein
MITHKEATATHPVSATATIAVSHNLSAAAQAVDQVRSDMSSQWQQSVAGSAAPNTGAYHAGQDTVLRGANDPADGGSDPSKRGDNSAASLDGISSAVDALRNSVLNDLDPTKDHDPTKHGISDLVGGNLPSAADLFAQLGLPGKSDQTNPRDHTAAGSTGSHPARPDGSSDNQTNPEAHHNALEGMLSDAQTWSYDYKSKDGHDHHKEMELEGHYYHESDKDLTTGGEHDTTIGVMHGKVKETNVYVDPATNETKKIDSDGNVTVTDTKTGKVKSKDVPLEPLAPEHKDGNGTKIPDEDHQHAPVDPIFNKLMQDAIKSEHLPTHENDNRDPVDTEIPGTVSLSDVRATAIVDTKATLLTDNRNGSEGLSDVGHGGGGGVPTNHNQAGPDFGGPDYAPTPQSSGPEERGPQPAIKTDPTGGAHGGSQGNNGSQNGGDSHAVSQIAQPIETTAQHLAHEVQDAYNANHPDQSHKTAQSLNDVHTGHDIASVLGGTVGGHDNGAFADLIRLAQNPAQSGLVPPPVAAGHDAIAALQLSALGDLAGHAADVHHVDDLHAAALALPAAVHEDVSHVTAAVIDHGHH